jgi:hypothetical protein
MTSLLAHFRLHETRKAFAWVVMLAFLVRAIIPVGFMPDMDAAAKGIFKISICSMQGARNILVDAGGQPVKDHPAKKQADTFCPFGGFSKLALETFAPQLTASHFAYIQKRPIAQEFFVSLPFYYSAQPRGPPAASFA